MENFVSIYNQGITNEREKCYGFTGNANNSVLNDFRNRNFRTLVICGSLLEGFDHPNVSVVGIARNVQSTIIFAQFIGRSFRKINSSDTVKATIVTDKLFRQRIMWQKFEQLPEREENGEDEENLGQLNYLL